MEQGNWDKRVCPTCKCHAFWEMHYNGKASCTACGVLAEAWAFEGFQTSFAHGYSPLSTLQQNQAYTRTKVRQVPQPGEHETVDEQRAR